MLQCRATLVVCPVSLMGQWATELADKTNGRLKVLMHHGLKHRRDPKDLLDYDVVLVTYQIIAQEWVYLQHTKSDRAELAHDYPTARIKWHRLVLDEAHTAKNL
jgi:SNF2 family DNA or RNA helicase